MDWTLINLISTIDRFDASWTAIERKEGQSLKELKSIATVRNVGASNRIEGNRMSDEEVDVLLQKIDITKLTDTDSQEVVGYFEVLDLISESYESINLTPGVSNSSGFNTFAYFFGLFAGYRSGRNQFMKRYFDVSHAPVGNYTTRIGCRLLGLQTQFITGYIEAHVIRLVKVRRCTQNFSVPFFGFGNNSSCRV